MVVRAPPFPVVGAIAPAVTATVVWWLTGSPFALLGAVIAPTMVVAHFLDARRLNRRESERDRDNRARLEAVEFEARQRERELDIARLNRRHPSIADIASHVEWTPARDGSTLVRAGRLVDWSPWLLDIAAGISVVGRGRAAEAVWESLAVNAVAQLGEPLSRENPWRWANGSVISRGEYGEAVTSIRCDGERVSSVSRRGEIPQRGEWFPDDVSDATAVWGRIGARESDPLRVTLSDDQPHVLVAGRTGSGKSRVLTALVVDWATRFDPTEVTFVGIDFKGGATLAPLSCLPHHLATVTDLESNDIPRVFAGIANDMRRREVELACRGVATISQTIGIPRMAIVIDEVQELLRHHPFVHDVLTDIARRGRSLGIHLVLALQHPTGVLREGLLGNVPVRICLTMNTLPDVAQVLGRVPPTSPEPANALVAPGDGSIREMVVPSVSDSQIARLSGPNTCAPPWMPPLPYPLPRSRHDGFGMLDDVRHARHLPATWEPGVGDVLVIGDSGSGRTSALVALVSGHNASWVRNPEDLSTATGIVVVDDVDRLIERAGPIEGGRFVDALARRRIERNLDAVILATTRSTLRSLGTFRNVLTLRTATLDDHRSTGAPPETFDPSAAPGVGTWRGLRCVVYASTESSETASIP